MPDGSDQYSQASVAKAIGKSESSFRSFLTSKHREALQCKEFGSAAIAVEGKNRAIKLAGLAVDVLQMLNGQYQLSQTSTSAVIDKRRESLSEFRGSKRPEAWQYKNLTSRK